MSVNQLVTTTIAGFGEVGEALSQIFNSAGYPVYIYDPQKGGTKAIKSAVLNICFPYKDESFIDEVVKLQGLIDPYITIIHSTVPVGTTRKIINRAFRLTAHSPIHGVHPNLEQGIRTFPKYIGATNDSTAELAKGFLEGANLKIIKVKNPETAELSKLACTLQYGWNIMLAKEIDRLCKVHGADFQKVYTDWNKHYNYGYDRLGKGNVKRPILDPKPGEIGGHCIIPNAELLNAPIGDMLVELNNEYQAAEDKKQN